jgi:hypothetical protein
MERKLNRMKEGDKYKNENSEAYSVNFPSHGTQTKVSRLGISWVHPENRSRACALLLVCHYAILSSCALLHPPTLYPVGLQRNCCNCIAGCGACSHTGGITEFEMNIIRGLISEDTIRYMRSTDFGSSNGLACHLSYKCRRHRRLYPY